MKIPFLIILILKLVSSQKETKLNTDTRIEGIEPNSGPTSGETRVLVRMHNFNEELIPEYPHPNCRFGSVKFTVNATYVRCAPEPRKVGEREPTQEERTEICIQCENSKPHNEDIVPFTVSLLGDFTDTLNSVPFRFYINPSITWIYPRYGPKDGGTLVEVYGENFLNYDQNLRCAFGSREVKAKYISPNKLECISPVSDVIQKKLPFSVSFNNQQNSIEDIPYVYYETPTVFRLEPNRGPDTGGTQINIRGQNFNPLVEITDMDNHNDTFCVFLFKSGEEIQQQAKVISSTEVECVSPPSYEEREVPVEITLNTREWTKDNTLFYYYHPPYVYTINPKVGPVSGGTNVSIVGSNFEDTGFVQCQFGDKIVEGEYIDKNKLACISPPVEKPATVNLKVAVRPDEFSSGVNTKYRYYATPVIDHIEPLCGPERGLTQITVYGKDFPVGYSNEVKCVFNRTIFTNATVMDENTIKCDSPSVLNYNGINENNITYANLEISINSKDFNGPEQKFYYYVSPFISNVNPIFGPIEGGTDVDIYGGVFNQEGACNVTVRFATYHVKPELDNIKSDNIKVKSPNTNYTGSVVVQVALNGQQFEDDITVNFRDKENTFYYYKCPLTVEINPEHGPKIGGTDITLYGVGFIEPYFALSKDGNNKINQYQDLERKIYYRFIDAYEEDTFYGETEYTIINGDNTQKIEIKSPSIINQSPGNDEIETKIQISYNGKDFCTYNQTFTFFQMPNILDISPKFAPLKSAHQQKVKLTLDNYYIPEETLESNNLKCKFKSISQDSNKVFIENAEYKGPNEIECETPNVNTPESFNIEASFNNGDDYTNNNHNFTFYDPYIISIEPQMVSSKGGTNLTIHGFGFADSGSDLKSLFGNSVNENGTLFCNGDRCIENAYYIDSNTISTITKPRNEISYRNGKPLGNERFPVEASVYNDDFTNNNITIFYYDEPNVVMDLMSFPSEKMNISEAEKEELNKILINSIPCNLDTFIPVPIDSSEISKYFKQVEPYVNYTCKYEVETGEEKVVDGVYTSYPLSNPARNLFLCQSPKFDNITGKSSLKVSINGYDYSENGYEILLTDPINIYKIEPPCGPVQGETPVTIYGSGFEDSPDYIFKWGPQNLVPLDQNDFMEILKDEETSPIILNNPKIDDKETASKFQISKMSVLSPTAPDYMKTRGGPDYISISKLNFLPLDEFLEEYYANNFIHTNFEYYYYHQVYVEGFSPKGSVVTGGANVSVIGAWFDNKPEYGVEPYCHFGEKKVKGIFHDTVRISCTSPSYEHSNVKVPFGVSLNGIDVINAENPFAFYNDFRYAKFNKVLPTSGPDSGGTTLKIFGTNFTSMVDESEFQCVFDPQINNTGMVKKKSPAVLRGDPQGNNSYIQCSTPGGWMSGTQADVKITFDGQNEMDTGHDFYFYKVEDIIPTSGPNTGEGDINIIGGGFLDSEKVKFKMDKTFYSPLNITNRRITCDMPAKEKDFTGYVDMGLTLNGIDSNDYKDGFYYYEQPIVDSVYPTSAPSKGEAKIIVHGKKFRDDFRGSNIGCKVNEYYGKGKVKSNEEMECIFEKLPQAPDEYIKKDDNTKVKASFPVQIALNNVSFTEPNERTTIIPYSVNEIVPSSGPIEGGTLINVKGSGFNPEKTIRCRFGVPGYFAVTEATYVDYNHITCLSPSDYQLPPRGMLPFSVPFGVAMEDDEYNPFTETSHFFSFYSPPEVKSISEKEVKTNQVIPLILKASKEKDKTFTTPSVSLNDEEYTILTNNGTEKIKSNKVRVKYQPILCRFGRFGTTEAEYFNRTHIKCNTPNIEDDSDIGFEEIDVDVAENGIDFVKAGKLTLQGPNSGKMIWVYILILLLILALLAGLVYLVYKYWDQVKNQFQGIKASQGDDPHTVAKKLKYLIEEENGLRENDPVEVGDDNRNFGNRLRENNNFGNGSRENDPIEVNNENSNGP